MYPYEDDEEFLEIVGDLITNEKVKQMAKYRQHCDVSTYRHCINVAYISFIVCKKLGLDYVSATRAAMLHDLFLYDWREKRPYTGLFNKHAFSHPRIALENAKTVCPLNKMEKDIIVKHMWPVTLLHIPRYRESFIVSMADKYSALQETKQYIIKKKRVMRAYKISFLVSNAFVNATIIF